MCARLVVTVTQGNPPTRCIAHMLPPLAPAALPPATSPSLGAAGAAVARTHDGRVQAVVCGRVEYEVQLKGGTAAPALLLGEDKASAEGGREGGSGWQRVAAALQTLALDATQLFPWVCRAGCRLAPICVWAERRAGA